MAGGAAARRPRAPRRGGLRRRHPRRAWRAAGGAGAPAGARTRRSPRSTSGRATPTACATRGAPTWPCAGRRWSAWGPSTWRWRAGGDEQEWQDRLLAEAGTDGACQPASVETGTLARRNGGGADTHPRPIVYVAAAALDHRRTPADARLRPLARAARARGRASRRYDAWRGEAPPLRRELRTLAGCAGHAVRRRCAAGVTMAAHSLGRLEQGLRERRHPPARSEAEDFLSGESGTVGGLDAARRELVDRLADAREMGSGRRLRLACAARRTPRAGACSCSASSARSGTAWPPRPARSWRAPATTSRCTSARRASAGSSRTSTACSPRTPPTAATGCCCSTTTSCSRAASSTAWCSSRERFWLRSWRSRRTALRSHAAWRVTRRRAGVVARETPLRGDRPRHGLRPRHAPRAAALPRRAHGLGPRRCTGPRSRASTAGAAACSTPSRSATRAAPAGAAYARADAVAEARALLAERPYLSAAEAQRTLATAPALVRVAVVAEFYPQPRRPGAGGLGAPPGARGARGGRRGARARAPPARAAAGGPAGRAGRRSRGRSGSALRDAAGGARCATGYPSRTCPTSRRRGGAPTPRWGAWAAPALGVALRRLRRRGRLRPRARPQRGARRRRRAPRSAPAAPARRLRARRRRALHRAPLRRRRARPSRAGSAPPAWCSPTARGIAELAREHGARRDARRAPRHRPAALRGAARGARARAPRPGHRRAPRRPQAPRRRAARARRARRAPPHAALRDRRRRARARRAGRARRRASGSRERVEFPGQLPPAAALERARTCQRVRDALDRGGVRRRLRRGDGRRPARDRLPRRAGAGGDRGRRRRLRAGASRRRRAAHTAPRRAARRPRAAARGRPAARAPPWPRTSRGSAAASRRSPPTSRRCA